MTSAVAILERLLDGDVAQKEHTLETFSPHLSDLQTRMNGTFDKLVSECGAILGPTDFNSAPTDGDKVKAPLPGWSSGTARGGGAIQNASIVLLETTGQFFLHSAQN